MSLITQPLENSTVYFWEHMDKKRNSKVKYKFVPEYEREKRKDRAWKVNFICFGM